MIAMRFERIWAMPNKWTFLILPIAALLAEEVGEGVWYDPFAGLHSIVPFDCRNDLNPDMPAKVHTDALDFLSGRLTASAVGVLFDPPYSISQAVECYRSFGGDKLQVGVHNMRYWAECKNEMARIIVPDGKAICFGWSSMGLGKKRGFVLERLLLVPHGGSKNDTIVTVERKAVC